MLKIRFVMSAALLVACVLTGCRSTPEPEEEKKMKIGDLREVDAETVAAFARSAAVDLIEGLRDNDYQRFIKNLTPERQRKLSKSTFESVRQNLINGPGVPAAMPEHVALLDKQVVKIFVYTVGFEKEAVPPQADGVSTLEHDLLLGVSVGQADEKLYVVSFVFTDLFFY